MCLAIPSKIISIDENNNAQVDTLGAVRSVNLDLMSEDVQVGDYILLHVGCAIAKIDEAVAKESLELYKQIAQDMKSGRIKED